jgi:hypothetical protein
MAELDFTLLPNSALKFLTLCWQIAVCTPRIATVKMVILLIAQVRSLNLQANSNRPKLSACFILGLRAGVGNPQWLGKLFAKELFLWQSAELERES